MTTIELEQIIDRAIIDRVDKLVLQKCGLSILPASIGNLRDLKLLDLYKNNLKVIPESIGNLSKLTNLNLNLNQIITLPDSICQLTNLTSLVLSDNQLTSLPADIGNLSNLTRLYVRGNLLTSFPPSMRNLSNLTEIYINDNPWNDLSNLQDIPNLKRVYFLGINLHRKYWTHLDKWKSEYLLNEDNPHLRQMLIDRIGLPQIVEDLTSFLNLSANKLNSLPQNLANLSSITHVDLNFYSSWTDLSGLQNIPNLQTVHCFNVMLERRYWTKLNEWKSEWLLDEENAEVRRAIVEQVGYEKICDELNAIILDTWREYTLLEIEGIKEEIYDGEYEPVDSEPMILLKMTCPSTAHIHILRVPPEMVSAEAAITWVNHGIHPDRFAIQT